LAVFVPLGSGAPQADQAHVAHTASTAACPWLNQSLPISKRVDLLLARMNLTDEIAEMYVDPGTKVGPYAGYGGAVPAQPALCIPALVEQDDSVGVGDGATDVTQLPAEVSLGSAWSPSLARQYGALNGLEHWEKGIAMALGPGVNIQRDPRWGRNFEMFSEDPFLTASLGAADIEGLQSEHALADVKHFVTYNQETNRNTPADNVILSARALHEIYLPPFYSAVKQADAASVMCSYASMAGQYSCQDPSQLTGVLDDRWGFQGFVRQWRQPFDIRLGQRGVGPGARPRLLARRPAGGGRRRRPGQAIDDQRGGPPDPDRDVPVRSVQRSAHRDAGKSGQYARRRRLRSNRRRARHRPAPEQRADPAA
jgi:beta-glucosidase